MKITRSWLEQQDILKKEFPFLTDQDFDFEYGQQERMLDRLSLKLKKSRFQLSQLLNNISKKHN